jgi:SAM-dependent MidA family methyltransferase
MLAHPLTELPPPPAAALELKARLEAHIRSEIGRAGGWVSFERYMALALYEPGLGYYSAGSTKLGRAGDFVTAPELSPLYAEALARQLAELIGCGLTEVLEVGPGSGALAADLLCALEKLGALPKRYFMLEVSGELRERQQSSIAERAGPAGGRVQWIDALPESLCGVVLASEVLDAMPVCIVRHHAGVLEEGGVIVDPVSGRFARAFRPAAGELLAAAERLALPEDYETEIHLAARGFVRSLGRALHRGALLVIDYGFPAGEYYHPQRTRGTLMCHYRHRAHDDPFRLVGLQDITAHVDFTALADAGQEAGLKVLGYTSQAQFLLNCGLLDRLSESAQGETRSYLALAAQAQVLLSPAEMGELFKVMALGRDVPDRLLGFARGDRTHRL